MPIRSRRERAVVLAVALAMASAVTGCSDDASSAAPTTTSGAVPELPAAGPASARIALDEGRIVIDVRSGEEFALGHVDGAERIGLAADDFDERIERLDPNGRYVVYCRTGNRSATAAAAMRELGLDVLDGGGLDDMTEAGWRQVVPGDGGS